MHCSKKASSLDHLVGAAEQRERNGEAERLRGDQIDDELEFGWLLDRNVGGRECLNVKGRSRSRQSKTLERYTR